MVSSFSLCILMGAEVGWRRNKEGFGAREVTVFFLTIVIAEQVLEKKKKVETINQHELLSAEYSRQVFEKIVK